ncbi:MAG: hypothetical protein EBS92_07345, partial [Proteobacteria bacterium]|nr:hypothetical protein [Pseudomonadota bacterium]
QPTDDNTLDANSTVNPPSILKVAKRTSETPVYGDSAGQTIPPQTEEINTEFSKRIGDGEDKEIDFSVNTTKCFYLKNNENLPLGFELTEKQKQLLNINNQDQTSGIGEGNATSGESVSDGGDSNPKQVLNTISSLYLDKVKLKRGAIKEEEDTTYKMHTFYIDKKGMEQYEKIHEKIHEKIVEEIGSGRLTKENISEAFDMAIEEMKKTDFSIKDSTKKLATDKNKPNLDKNKLNDQDIEDINEIISCESNSNQKAIQIMELLVTSGSLKISSVEVIRQVDKDGKRKDDKAEIKISCGYEGTVNLARKEGGKVDIFSIRSGKATHEGIYQSDLKTKATTSVGKFDYKFTSDDDRTQYLKNLMTGLMTRVKNEFHKSISTLGKIINIYSQQSQKKQSTRLKMPPRNRTPSTKTASPQTYFDEKTPIR